MVFGFKSSRILSSVDTRLCLRYNNEHVQVLLLRWKTRETWIILKKKEDELGGLKGWREARMMMMMSLTFFLVGPIVFQRFFTPERESQATAKSMWWKNCFLFFFFFLKIENENEAKGESDYRGERITASLDEWFNGNQGAKTTKDDDERDSWFFSGSRKAQNTTTQRPRFSRWENLEQRKLNLQGQS